MKSKIRQTILARRKALDDKQRKLMERNLAAKFMGNFPLELGDAVAGYASINGEIGCELIIEILQDMGYRTSIPAIVENSKLLEFRQFNKGDRLYKSAKHLIPEPLSTKPLLLPNIVLVPLLAVDLKGNRIGYGGGYYDATLQALSKVEEIVAVGLAYDFQIINHISPQEHDYKLDVIITDKRVVVCE